MSQAHPCQHRDSVLFLPRCFLATGMLTYPNQVTHKTLRAEVGVSEIRNATHEILTLTCLLFSEPFLNLCQGLGAGAGGKKRRNIDRP